MVLKSLALCAELSTGGIFMRFQSRLPMSVDTACPRSSISSNSRSSSLPPASPASLLISTLSPRSILRRRLLTITVPLLLPCTHPTVIQTMNYLQLMGENTRGTAQVPHHSALPPPPPLLLLGRLFLLVQDGGAELVDALQRGRHLVLCSSSSRCRCRRGSLVSVLCFSGDASAAQLVVRRRGPLRESTTGPDLAARRHPAASGRLGVVTVDVMGSPLEPSFLVAQRRNAARGGRGVWKEAA
jgi:hypothetical protein